MPFTDQAFEDLKRADAEAKARGAIVGRYITSQVADGFAYYRVISQAAGTCRLEFVHICDGYKDITLEQVGCKLPLAAVKARIEGRDRMDAFFARKG